MKAWPCAWLILAAMAAGCSTRHEEGASASATPASSASGGIAATSAYDAGPRAFESPIDEERVKAGAGLFQTKGCAACHAFGKKVTGPDLQGVTHRRTAVWMENQILHPEIMTKSDPISHELLAKYAVQMPNQGLTPDEARAVIDYFKKMDHEAFEHEAATKEEHK
jgi:cytochrome c551/c552